MLSGVEHVKSFITSGPHVLSYVIKMTLKSHFWPENVKILLLCMQHRYGHHYIILPDKFITSGLSFVMHDISLPDHESFWVKCNDPYQHKQIIILEDSI